MSNPQTTHRRILALCLTPSAALLCKLGSIVVHADEGLGPNGHEFDITALKQLLADQEVNEWLADMNNRAMLPVKRSK